MNFGMCGRWRNGRLASICTMAGTEECDFECPHRDEPSDKAKRFDDDWAPNPNDDQGNAGVTVRQTPTDAELVQMAIKAGLDEEMWFGPHTPPSAKDCLPLLRRFAEAVLTNGVNASVAPSKENGNA